jgi:formiminoglutamase
MTQHAFIPYTYAAIAPLIDKRTGEIKLGEALAYIQHPDKWETELAQMPATHVLLGAPEDIGVRANGGIGGAQSLWQPALKALLNVQYTDRLPARNLCILGVFDFSALLHEAKDLSATALRPLVHQIDELVYPVIQRIAAMGKVPVLIGGGHNNAYPLLKGVSIALGKKIHCINLDAHSDYRAMEGRHSGNGFRYARAAGYLDRYAIVGLQENYNSAQVVKDLEADPAIHFSWYESIFIREEQSFAEALATAISHVREEATGIELDLDCIERVLSSAATPCGVSVIQARQYLHICLRQLSAGYIHLAEGATQLQDGRTDPLTAKLIAFLVTDMLTAIL